MLGLSPAAYAALVLYKGDGRTLKAGGALGLKNLKVAELVFEALPQSILQCVRLLSFHAPAAPLS